MKILVFSKNQPCLHVAIIDVPKGTPNYGVKYGLNRDRHPDTDWGELRRARIDNAVKIELTSELKQILLEDLAFTYGQDSKKFTEKLKEFKLL